MTLAERGALQDADLQSQACRPPWGYQPCAQQCKWSSERPPTSQPSHYFVSANRFAAVPAAYHVEAFSANVLFELGIWM